MGEKIIYVKIDSFRVVIWESHRKELLWVLNFSQLVLINIEAKFFIPSWKFQTCQILSKIVLCALMLSWAYCIKQMNVALIDYF